MSAPVVHVPYGHNDELVLLATLTVDGRPVLKQADERSTTTSLTNCIGVQNSAGLTLAARVRTALGLPGDGPVWLYKLDPTLHKNVWSYNPDDDHLVEYPSWGADTALVDAVDRLVLAA